MYYLAKFCRICIQTDGKLLDIESLDYDSVKFSEKLKICAQMVITEDSLSTKICTSCIQKLRVSYQFHSMCRRSTTILQQHLTELIRTCEKLDPNKFVNSEVIVAWPPLKKAKRKRVGKDEKCSLLRKLLSKITNDHSVQNVHINRLTKLCDTLLPTAASSSSELNNAVDSNKKSTNRNIKKEKSNLGNLIQFIKEYNYEYDIKNAKSICNSCDLTPLEKLQQFTNTFFFDHFTDYRNTVIRLRDNFDFDSSEDESMFEREFIDECVTFKTESNLVQLKREFIEVDPLDITIKDDIESVDVVIKKELNFEEEFDENSTEFSFSSNLVQACYDENSNNSCINIKQEKESCLSSKHKSEVNLNPVSKLETITERISPLVTILNKSNSVQPSSNECSSLFSHVPQLYSSLNDYPRRNKTFSHQNTRCRTRGNPFINPQLKRQFLYRNFECEICNRRFKSLGYLKVHKNKLKH